MGGKNAWTTQRLVTAVLTMAISLLYRKSGKCPRCMINMTVGALGESEAKLLQASVQYPSHRAAAAMRTSSSSTSARGVLVNFSGLADEATVMPPIGFLNFIKPMPHQTELGLLMLAGFGLSRGVYSSAGAENLSRTFMEILVFTFDK